MFTDPHPKFIMLNPNPSSDSTRRWGLWEVNRSLSSVFLKGVSARTKEAPWLFFNTREHRRKSAVCDQEAGPSQSQAMLVSGSWTS